MDIRIGNGYDVHALAEGLPLWLGGVQIESPIGCIAGRTCTRRYRKAFPGHIQ